MTTTEAEGEDLPVPAGGLGTWLLALLTSGEWEDPREITIRRYFMRLRIVWFFLCAFPIAFVAFAATDLAIGGIEAIVGPDAHSALVTGTFGLLLGIGLLLAAFAILIKGAATVFRWMTRGYRANLVAEATLYAGADVAARPSLNPLSLDELDVPLATNPNDGGSERE